MAGVKILTPVLLCLALASNVLPVPGAKPKTPETAPVVEEVQVEVRPSKDRYLGGEPVIVTVTLRNNSSKPVSFLMLGPKFEFAVRNNLNKKGKGRLVALTGKGHDESTGEKFGQYVVNPGDFWQYKIVLNRLFDMSRAGTYTISGHKNLRNETLPVGNLLGTNKLARDVKVVVLDGDVSDAR